ncbi:MAG TPA: MBOAT family protein [Acidimicrobiales bacterium]|jgi:alginate O-acetyltransferase complex protein AlgI|nr:MBOAT family protein [Acidimicrobiales bacterium]
MVFNSLQYLVFFPLVFAVYWQLKRRGQNVLLLLASWFFYAMWDWRFLGLMLLTTGVDFGVGRYLAMTEDEKKRKLAFGLSLGLNLTVLGFFKYFNFFVGSAADLLQTFGLDASEPTLRVLLPVGISFYTFHGISYTFDVFRRDIEPADDLLDFAVFVAFFPQLVAGPIGRAHLQLPQFEHERPPLRWEQARSGLCLILLGLFKKVAIADALAPFVDRTFTEPGRASWISLLGGAYAFALQIYGDFAGYSDVARGSSRLLGIELPLNFEQPYLSRNITVFWRTWHISLSNWLRDYLYIPLGGNRGSRAKTYRNLMLTMVLGGLWHGAAWTFVAWGTLNGLYLCAHRWFTERPGGAGDAHNGIGRFTWRDVLPAIGTFQLVVFAWIFFRSASFAEAFDVITGILTLQGGVTEWGSLFLVGALGIVTIAIDIAQRNTDTHTPMLDLPPALQGALYGAFVVAIVLFSGGATVPFIYFQF